MSEKKRKTPEPKDKKKACVHKNTEERVTSKENQKNPNRPYIYCLDCEGFVKWAPFEEEEIDSDEETEKTEPEKNPQELLSVFRRLSLVLNACTDMAVELHRCKTMIETLVDAVDRLEKKGQRPQSERMLFGGLKKPCNGIEKPELESFD